MDELVWLLVSWPIAGFVLFLLLHRRKTISVGLPLAYFMGLFIIHWPGAATYLVPDRFYYDPELVLAGFRLTTYGLWAFVVGVWLGGRRGTAGSAFFTRGRGQRTADGRYINGIAIIVFALGLLIRLGMLPFLGGVATLTAVLSGMAGLSVVGVCLGIRGALIQRNKNHLRLWLLIALFFPFITLATSAFIGFGVHSLIVVVAFIFTQTRTGVLRALTVLLAVYMGFSLFVTYMREREQIRGAIWYEQVGYEQRLEKIFRIFTDFEFFDVTNPEHLNEIDRRLNQNWLVGSSVRYIDAGNIEYAHGETLWFALIALVPRAVWPGKPVVGGGGDIVSKYTGITFAEGTSVGVGQVMEFFINFGTFGVVIGFLAFGAAIRQFDSRAARGMFRQNYRAAVLWFLPGLGFLQAGGNLVEVTTSVGAGFVGAWIAGEMIKLWIRRNQVDSHSSI